jgi:hypothetical protein
MNSYSWVKPPSAAVGCPAALGDYLGEALQQGVVGDTGGPALERDVVAVDGDAEGRTAPTWPTCASASRLSCSLPEHGCPRPCESEVCDRREVVGPARCVDV